MPIIGMVFTCDVCKKEIELKTLRYATAIRQLIKAGWGRYAGRGGVEYSVCPEHNAVKS